MGSLGTGLALPMTWQMFAVTLNGIDVNPQFVNPDTLRYNGVVNAEWLLNSGALFGPGNASFAYSNGVSVTASESALCFRQIGDVISETDVLCDRLVAKYLDTGLPGDWLSTLTEFGILFDVDPGPAFGQESEFVSSMQDSLAFEGVAPDELSITLSYETGRRRLTVSLSVGSGSSGFMRCYGRVQRYLDEDLSQAALADGTEQLRAHIGNWPDDYKDVASIAKRYIDAIIRMGSP